MLYKVFGLVTSHHLTRSRGLQTERNFFCSILLSKLFPELTGADWERREKEMGVLIIVLTHNKNATKVSANYPKYKGPVQGGKFWRHPETLRGSPPRFTQFFEK